MNCFSLWYFFVKKYLVCYLKADVSDISGRKLEYPAKISRCHAFYLLNGDGVSASATGYNILIAERARVDSCTYPLSQGVWVLSYWETVFPARNGQGTAVPNKLIMSYTDAEGRGCDFAEPFL
jgi:hypothetical protein